MAVAKALPRRGFGLAAAKVGVTAGNPFFGTGETAGISGVGSGCPATSSALVVSAIADANSGSGSCTIKGCGRDGCCSRACHPTGASTNRWRTKLAPSAQPSRTPGRSKRIANIPIGRECYRREGNGLPPLTVCSIPLGGHTTPALQTGLLRRRESAIMRACRGCPAFFDHDQLLIHCPRRRSRQ